jgi:hypothetical protein
MLKQLAALGILAPLTLANLSSRVEAAGWGPLALIMGNHLSRAFDGGLRHGGSFYRPQFDPRRYGGFSRDGAGFYRDGGFYRGDGGFYRGDGGFYRGDGGFYRGDGGFYRDAGLRRAPYSQGYWGVADGGSAGCGSSGAWGGYGGYDGYDYDGYGW